MPTSQKLGFSRHPSLSQIRGRRIPGPWSWGDYRRRGAEEHRCQPFFSCPPSEVSEALESIQDPQTVHKISIMGTGECTTVKILNPEADQLPSSDDIWPIKTPAIIYFLENLRKESLLTIEKSFNIDPDFFEHCFSGIASRGQYNPDPANNEDHIRITIPFLQTMNVSPDQTEEVGGYHVDMIGIYIMRSSADVKGKLKDGTDARGTTIICYCPPQKYPRSVKSIVDWTKDIIIDPEWKYPNVGFDTDPLLPVLPILWYTLYSWWDLLQYLFQNISHLERILLQDPNVEDTRQLNKIRLDLQSYLLIFNDYNDIIQYLLGIAKAQTSTIDPLQRNSYNFSSVANLGTPPSTPTGPAPRTPGAYKPSPLAAPPLVVSPPPTPSTMTNPLRIQTGFKLGPLPMTPSTPRGTSTVETHHHQRRNSRGQTSSYFQLQPDLSQLHSNSNGVQEEKATNAQTTRPPPPNSRHSTSSMLIFLPSEHFYTDLSSLVDKIIKEAEILGSRIDSARTMVFSDVAIRESITMRQLSYIAVLYLPATFSAGIFGMNVQQITTSTLDQFLAVALSFSAATIWIFVAIILHGSTMARILWPLYYSRYFIFDVLLVYALERWSWAAQKVADWRREKSSTDPPDYRPERSPSSPSEFEIKVETPSAEAREEQWVPEFRTPVFGKE